VSNWFSILVNGLNFDKVVNGRYYGNGIYMALDFETSLGYATSNTDKLTKWGKSSLNIEKLLSLNEVVNKPQNFVQTNPYLVVNKPEWVQTRYLLVASTSWEQFESAATNFIPQDPLFTSSVDVPKPQEKKLMLCTSAQVTPREISDLIEPSFASALATKSLFKNLRHMLKNEPSPLWTIDLDNMESLYKWNVTLTGFDKDLPLSQDLKKLGLNGINLELYFGPEFPYMPAFVRVVSPRFLPFSQGGGGHITSGGSICMDLLTSDGWLPSYSIEAVIIQVYLQISSIDPRPARLEIPKSSYQLQEAMDAFERVAKDHGWKINKNFRQFTL
jgi:ubiquitin-conjugating enzyme E2 Q